MTGKKGASADRAVELRRRSRKGNSHRETAGWMPRIESAQNLEATLAEIVTALRASGGAAAPALATPSQAAVTLPASGEASSCCAIPSSSEARQADEMHGTGRTDIVALSLEARQTAGIGADGAPPGCAVCRLAHRSTERSLKAFFAEFVNDPEVRARFRKSRGFCREHTPLLRAAAMRWRSISTWICRRGAAALALPCARLERLSVRALVFAGQRDRLPLLRRRDGSGDSLFRGARQRAFARSRPLADASREQRTLRAPRRAGRSGLAPGGRRTAPGDGSGADGRAFRRAIGVRAQERLPLPHRTLGRRRDAWRRALLRLRREIVSHPLR